MNFIKLELWKTDLKTTTHIVKLIDFNFGLPILTNWKKNSYDFIFIIVDCLKKVVYYKLVKIMIYTLEVVKVILNVIIFYNDLLTLIITNKNYFFSLKFWVLVCKYYGNIIYLIYNTYSQNKNFQKLLDMLTDLVKIRIWLNLIILKFVIIISFILFTYYC